MKFNMKRYFECRNNLSFMRSWEHSLKTRPENGSNVAKGQVRSASGSWDESLQRVIQNELHGWIFGNASLIMFGSLVDLSQSIGVFLDM